MCSSRDGLLISLGDICWESSCCLPSTCRYVLVLSDRGLWAWGSQMDDYLYLTALLTVILIVRQVMASVDLEALEDLRYDYKGA
jgi:hypothetical protein